MDLLRERQAVTEPVERAAALTDVLSLDAKGFLNAGENPSDFLMADENISLVLEQTADWPMPGFAQQIVGLAPGEEKKFDLTFPEDYANESLRGQTAHFEVKVKEVKARTLPEWDDELAKSVGDYESLDDLRTKVRESLVRRAERQVKSDYADKVVDTLAEQATVAYPPVLLENELDDYMEDLDRRLREQKLTLDDYLKIEGKTKEQMRDEARPQAEKRLKRSLVLGEVMAKEQIHVHDEDVDARIDLVTASFGEQASQMKTLLNRPESRRAMATEVLTEKALDRITAIARGEEVPAPGDDEHHHHDDEHDHDHDHGAEAVAEAQPEPASETVTTAEGDTPAS
jgi:trigger factor